MSTTHSPVDPSAASVRDGRGAAHLEGEMPSSSTTPRRHASIVIPAHNEGPVIDRCLDALASAARDDGVDLEVVVVANGCSDDTAARAARHRGVAVVDLAEPGKRLALDAGDERSQTFPRIFLDADVILAPGALRQLVDALAGDTPRVAAPTVRFDVTGATPAVRAFYRVFERLPYVRDDLIGLGVYGLNEAGRARFDRFPELIADDLFIQRLFDPSERVVVPGRFDVRVPRDLGNLLKVRTRVARGNAQLARSAPSDTRFDTSTSSTTQALRSLGRHEPARIPDIAVYVAVTLAARLRAKRTATVWERDESSRTP